MSSFAVCYRNKLWRNEIATRKRLETRLRRQNTKEEIIFHLSKSSGMSGRKILFRMKSCVFNYYQIFLKDSEVNRKFWRERKFLQHLREFSRSSQSGRIKTLWTEENKINFNILKTDYQFFFSKKTITHFTARQAGIDSQHTNPAYYRTEAA